MTNPYLEVIPTLPDPVSPHDSVLDGWYHTLDLGGDLQTRGIYYHRPVVPLWGLPDDLTGKRALDVGTFDGFWAFELEARGAAVTAIDVSQWRDMDWMPQVRAHLGERLNTYQGTRFKLAHRLKQSAVDYRSMSVYDLSPDVVGMFDIVICGSLLLHLQNPLLALARIRSVTAGDAYIETTLDEDLERSHPNVSCMHFGHREIETLPGENCAYWRFNTQALLDMLIYAGFPHVTARARYAAPYRDGRPGVDHVLAIGHVNAPQPAQPSQAVSVQSDVPIETLLQHIRAELHQRQLAGNLDPIVVNLLTIVERIYHENRHAVREQERRLKQVEHLLAQLKQSSGQ